MKKEDRDSNRKDMRKEYDFSEGVRGKHYKAYREGHTVLIHNEDGTSSVHYFTQEDGAIMLDPDVKPYFPDSDSVNKSLRKGLKRKIESHFGEETDSSLIARMPWREQPIRVIKYPEDYEASEGSSFKALR